MAEQLEEYAYNYAVIDLDTGLCDAVFTDTAETVHPAVIPIPVYDEEYVDKYYNQANGEWYWDAEFTRPWRSALLD